MNNDHDEIEWQFEADDLPAIRRQLARIARQHDLTPGKPTTKTHRDTYFDSNDWRMHGSGYALRLRQPAKSPSSPTPAEITMKSLDGGEAELRRRREITETIERAGQTNPAALGSAPGAVGERIRAILGPNRLLPIFEIVTTRTTFRLSRKKEPAAEVALDDTLIPAPAGRAPVRLRRVEIEVAPGMLATVRLFVDDLKAALDLRPAEASKFETALRTRGLTPTHVTDRLPDSPAIDAGRGRYRTGELALAMLRQRTLDLLTCEPATRVGDDTDALHDMRVATRRLRAILRLFEDVLPEQGAALNEGLRWIARALGAVRDLDVQLEQVRTRLETAEADTRAPLETLIHLLHQDRLAARRRLLEALDSDRYSGLVDGLVALLAGGMAHLARPARKSAFKAMPDLIRRRYRRVRRLGDALRDASAPEEFHAVRIQCKRLRYALECAEPLYGKPVQTLIKRLAGVQDVLGQYQDTQVAVGRMRELCARHQDELSPQVIQALSEIAQRYACEGDSFKQQFWPAYRKLKGRAWKRLRKKMDTRRDA